MSDVHPATPPGSPPAQAAATPGQRAYAVMHRASGVDVPHEDLDDDDKRLWDDIAAAVMLMAQAAVDYAELQELRGERDKAYRERAALVAYLAACYPAVMLTDSAEPDWPIVFVMTPAGQMSWHVAQGDLELFGHVPATTEPTWDGHTTEVKYERLAELTRQRATATVAPELAAAMAETRAVRDGYQALCGEFGPSAQSGWSARISLTVLNRHRAAAGLDRFSRTESNDREDITMRYRRERDEAQAELADARADREHLRIDRNAVVKRAADCMDERDAHKVRADHYEGLWRAEHGLPPEDPEGAALESNLNECPDGCGCRALAAEILAAYESGTVVSGELLGIWRERLGAP